MPDGLAHNWNPNYQPGISAGQNLPVNGTSLAAITVAKQIGGRCFKMGILVSTRPPAANDLLKGGSISPENFRKNINGKLHIVSNLAIKLRLIWYVVQLCSLLEKGIRF